MPYPFNLSRRPNRGDYMEVFTQYFHSRSTPSNPGSSTHYTRTACYDDIGRIVLKVTGKEDLYAYIQSHRDSVDIKMLVARFQAGDKDVLSRVQGFYGDVSGMPTTYAGMLNAVLAGEQAFDKLPISVKESFHNSFAEWMAAMDSPDFAKRMGLTDGELSSRVADVASPSGSSVLASSGTSESASDLPSSSGPLNQKEESSL